MMGCANGKLEPETPQNNHLVEVYGGQRHGVRNGQTVAYRNAQNRQVHQKKGVVPPPDGGQPKTNKKVTITRHCSSIVRPH